MPDHVFDWSFTNEVQTGRFALTDYDFTKPQTNLLVKSAVQRSHPQAGFECFDYPGEYQEIGDGEGYARCRIEELHARYERLAGQGNARGIATGALFKLTGHPREDQNRDLLVTSSDFVLSSDEYFGTGTTEDICQCRFTAIEQNTPFRPARTTGKPRVQGPQTAVVVGPSGDEIYTDPYGRVKVHFHWDRKDRWESGKQDQDASCWMRVSQPWAGKNWGTVAIPRIGQEVIVDFLEGDPDQPIITGRVYNASQRLPYSLPGGAHMMGFKSNSTPGGSGYCEMVIHDDAGKEKIVLHSQKDMSTTARNNDTQHIMVDRSIQVDGKHTETIRKDMQVTVTEGNHSTRVQAGHLYIEAAETITLKVGGSTVILDKNGNISVDGVYVKVVGSSKIDLNP